MKTYEVEVTYQVQPGENPIKLSETYTVQAGNAFDAECIAMEKCASEFWTHEPIEATAELISEPGCKICGVAGEVKSEDDICASCEASVTDAIYDLVRDGWGS